MTDEIKQPVVGTEVKKSPIEFVIYKSDGSKWKIKYFYRDNSSEEYGIDELPKGIKPNHHYFIGDYEGTF